MACATTLCPRHPSAQAAPLEVSLAPLCALLTDAHAADEPFVRTERAEAARHEAGWTVASGKLGATFSVNVTNTGSVDSDDVVLGFLTPPGAGQNGVPLQSLFGFERVHVKAGASVTVYLYPELTEFAQVGPDGTRAALLGEYTVRFGEARSAKLGQGLVEHKFTLSSDL